MITTKLSTASMVNVLQTLGALLSKPCRSGKEEGFVSMDQFPLSRMTKWLWNLSMALILLASLTSANLAHAAGRVFYDGFEDGTTNKWQQDDYRNRCAVVSSTLDGGPGPHGGTKMLRCNWNGTVDWNDPANYEALALRTWSYSTEFLVRFWIRTDNNFNGLSGPKYYRIGSDSSGSSLSFGGLHVGGGQTLAFYNTSGQIGSTYWGGGSSAANGAWHKVEIYIKQGVLGVARLWEDDVKVWETVNVSTLLGGSWTPFYISSNWSGADGCCNHDANNHLYWDEFEIYSDTGTGAIGSMSDATISSSDSGSQTVPAAPQGVQIIVP